MTTVTERGALIRRLRMVKRRANSLWNSAYDLYKSGDPKSTQRFRDAKHAYREVWRLRYLLGTHNQ